jgi:hypothetical protein
MGQAHRSEKTRRDQIAPVAAALWAALRAGLHHISAALRTAKRLQIISSLPLPSSAQSEQAKQRVVAACHFSSREDAAAENQDRSRLE